MAHSVESSLRKMVKKGGEIWGASLKILAMYNHILVELPANFSKVFCSQ